MLEFLKRKSGGESPFLESPWGRFGISDEDVAAYYAKNDEYEQNVPLQIAQRLLDDAANKFVSTVTCDPLDLARAQGVLQGISMVALELVRTQKAARRFAVAGGLRQGARDE